MARRYTIDCINVIDVESTCWQGEAPAGEAMEIIEIGVAVVDLRDTNNKYLGPSVVDNFNIYVRPEYSGISEFCTSLTGITTDTLEQAVPFAVACQRLVKSLDSKNRIWASYGDFDRNQFQKDCNYKKVSYPFGHRHLNVKTLFALSQGLDYEVGMDVALEMLGMALEGRHHSGKDDALNIARILGWALHSLRTGDTPNGKASDNDM